MNNYKLRKAVYLSLLSSILLSGCGKKEVLNTEASKEYSIDQVKEYNLDINVVSNQTIAKIIDEYKEKSGNEIDYNQVKVHEYYKPKYIWSYKDSEGELKYVFDYRINGNDDSYRYVDCSSNSTLYIVKIDTIKDGNTWYEPVCALLQKGDEVVNVIATTLDDKGNVHNPFEDYIYVHNPSNENIEELKNADEYLNATYKEPAFFVAPKQYKKSN